MKYIEALNFAMREALESDSKVLVFGEDVGKGGGIFGGSRYLQRDFGAQRVFDTPIAENAILGSAVGAAMQGLKPVVEIMWADFIFVALDQIINQAANVRYITGGATSVPMVVRTQQGALPGSCAQHSQSIEAILAHIPGVKVALPSSSDDAYTLLKAAIADPDPCVVIEARGLYQTKGPVHISDRAERADMARLARSGGDCSIITWGTMVPRALEAAQLLEARGGEAAVLELRWLNPLDEEAIRSADKDSNGRVLIVHEAVRSGGFAGELAIRIAELLPEMKLTIHRHTTPDVRIPASPILQQALLPRPETIADACAQVLTAARRQFSSYIDADAQ
ncbi:alpha-ketoacid dehydrogenase subunit beta [Devosia sp. A449]